MTDDSAFKKRVRARMPETVEKYTEARRAVIAGRDPGRAPVVSRVALNPHVDLELTGRRVRLNIWQLPDPPEPSAGEGARRISGR